MTASLYGPGSGYSKLTRPNAAALVGTGKPLEAAPADMYYFQMQFNQILSVNTQLQHFTVDVWTRETWYDWRLRHNSSASSGCFRNWTADPQEWRNNDPVLWHVLPLAEFSKLWSPSIAYQSSLDKPKVLMSASWIGSDGMVWISKRQIFEFSCIMDFSFMPYDRQLCHVPVKFFDYFNEEVLLLPGVAGSGSEAMKVTPRQGVFVGGPIEWHIDERNSVGKMVCEYDGIYGHSCSDFMKLTFSFERQPDYYIQHALMPVVLCVMLSWASFFISSAAAPARVALTVISFLTCMTRKNAVLETLPRMSGDVWLLDFMKVSLYFTLYASLEYAFVNYLMRAELRIRLPGRGCARGSHYATGSDQTNADETVEVGFAKHGFVIRDYHADGFSRCAFILVYAVVLISFFAKLPSRA